MYREVVHRNKLTKRRNPMQILPLSQMKRTIYRNWRKKGMQIKRRITTVTNNLN
jgi:hypothetical protein